MHWHTMNKYAAVAEADLEIVRALSMFDSMLKSTSVHVTIGIGVESLTMNLVL